MTKSTRAAVSIAFPVHSAPGFFISKSDLGRWQHWVSRVPCMSMLSRHSVHANTCVQKAAPVLVGDNDRVEQDHLGRHNGDQDV